MATDLDGKLDRGCRYLLFSSGRGSSAVVKGQRISRPVAEVWSLSKNNYDRHNKHLLSHNFPVLGLTQL